MRETYHRGTTDDGVDYILHSIQPRAGTRHRHYTIEDSARCKGDDKANKMRSAISALRHCCKTRLLVGRGLERNATRCLSNSGGLGVFGGFIDRE